MKCIHDEWNNFVFIAQKAAFSVSLLHLCQRAVLCVYCICLQTVNVQ